MGECRFQDGRDPQPLHELATSQHSEVHSCAQEHISGRIGTGRLPERSVLQLGIDGHQVYPIKQVEGIQTHLHVHPLGDAGDFLQRKIRIRVAGIEELVRSLISPSPGSC